MRILLFLLMLIFAEDVFAGPSFLEKMEALKAAGKMPGIARDGVLLPRELLLDQLKKSVNSEKKVEVKDLLLTEEKGTVILLSRSRIDTEISIDFRFLDVDWPNRTVWMSYSESAKSASDTLIGRILGTLAVSAFEAASGNPLESKLSGKPYFTVEGDKIGILLDRIPSLEKPLATRIGQVRLFDLIGVRRISTEKDRIHVVLGPV